MLCERQLLSSASRFVQLTTAENFLELCLSTAYAEQGDAEDRALMESKHVADYASAL